MTASCAIAQGRPASSRLSSVVLHTPPYFVASLVVAMMCGGEVEARTLDPGASTPRQPLTIERHPEDWSFLSEPSDRTGRWSEPFKYIPLDPTGSFYLTTGLEARARAESVQRGLWGAELDNDYVWLRLMPYADLHAGPMRVFVQPILSDISGAERPPSPVDTTGADVLQAFVQADFDVGETAALRVSAGRKLLTLGAGRLVDTRYGPNVPEAFEGLDATLDLDSRAVTALGMRPVDTRIGDFDDQASDQKALWGIYATQWFDEARRNGLDLFWLGYRDRRSVADQGVGEETLHTFGARSFGTIGSWFWNLEGSVQRGEFVGARTEAWAAGVEGGRRFEDAPLRPELSLTADYSSGDDDPGDDVFGTFNPMFPRGSYFVSQSPIGPRNIIHIQPSLTLHPHQDVQVTLAGARYWRASTGDGLYAMPGFLVRSGRGSRAREVGSHVEAAGAWWATPELQLSGSVSVFDAGRFIRETGPSETIVLANLTANFRF